MKKEHALIERLLFTLARIVEGDHKALDNAPEVVEQVAAEYKDLLYEEDSA